MGQKKYKAFISYSHKDAKVSKWLHQKLESYKVPKHLVGTKTEHSEIPSKLFPIFRDRDDLAATTHMTDAILEAVHESEFLIVICSPASAQSKLVNREIQEFKKLNGNENILCLIAGGVPFSRNPDLECFSEILQRHIAPDGTPADYAPEGLAADIRPGSDGRQAAVSKLVAGMLGVQLNILVRREMQQQKRRFLGILAGSAAILMLISVLLFNAIESQKLAEKRLQDTSRFLQFLHETVFEALDVDGNTTAQAELAKAVHDYYQNSGLESTDITFLGNWSGSVLRLGQNLERQGKNAEAAELFEQIRDFGIKFSEDNPTQFYARYRKQNAEFFYGYLKLRTGAYDEAEKSFRNRLQTVTDALTDPILTEGHEGPKESRWAPIISDSKSLLGKLLGGPQDQAGEAETLITRAIEYRLAAMEKFVPHNQFRTKTPRADIISITATYLNMADLYRRLGKLDDAQEFYQKRVDLLTGLLEETPDDLNVIRRKSIAELGVAKTRMDKGEVKHALSQTRDQVKTFHMLTEQNPASVLWFSGLVEAQNQLVDMCIMLGTCPDTEHHLGEAQRLSSELFTRDGDRPQYRLTYYKARMLQAHYMLNTSNPTAAQTELNALIETFEAEEDSFARTDGAMEVIARTYLLASILADQNGDIGAARQYAQTVVEAVDARPDPWPEAQAYQAMALEYLDDARAQEIRRTLDIIGFDYKIQMSLLGSATS